MSRVIAVDGPAASGKGTLARRLAAYYGYAHLDTGRLYRAVALRCLRRGIAGSDEPHAAAEAAGIGPEDLNDPRLRTEEIGRMASQVAALPLVRQALVDYQRRFASTPPGDAAGAVLDGRDIGTVICPRADAKLFVTASVEERANRRHKELLDQGGATIYAAVLRDLQERDARDSGRSISPLVRAEDAYLLDTTSMDADSAFAAALAFVQSKIGRP